MIKTIGICLIFLSILFVFFIVNSSADIYSWVDGKGVTHYSSTPPQGDTDLKVTIYPTAKSTKTDTTPPAVKNPIENMKSALKSIVLPTPARAPTPPTTAAPIAPKKEQSSKPKVELYVTSWCPWCKKAKAFFQSKNVELTIYDIEKDPKAAQRKQKLDSYGGVPFAVINEKHYVRGYNEEGYNSALKQ